ncbi:hypothetical protein A9Q86_04625 [Flavobacteriales bacterium 33_180_T64]|nr:hypothetical protein A9Q86_04625 [Flavobacteriales bacterium 33_180_T64]
MKKTFITLLFITLTFCAFGQKRVRHERIKTLKIAFITEKLQLSQIEAQKFWPIYNAFEKEMEMHKLSAREKRHNLNIETLTESQAKKTLSDFLAFEKELQELKVDLVESLLTAIPAKKIILLKLVEEQFNKHMLEEFRKRRDKFRKNTP